MEDDERVRQLEDRVTRLEVRLSPVERVVFGGVGLLLLAFGGAVIALVIR